MLNPRRTREKKINKLPLLILALILVGIGIYLYCSEQPEHSFRRLQESIYERNLTLFNEYVDLENILKKGKKSIFESVAFKEKKRELFRVSGTGLNIELELDSEAEAELIRRWQQNIENALQEGKICSFLSEHTPNCFDMLRVEGTWKGNDIAHLTVSYQDLISKRPVIFELTLQKLGNRWQIVEIADLKDLADIISKYTKN